MKPISGYRASGGMDLFSVPLEVARKQQCRSQITGYCGIRNAAMRSMIRCEAIW